MARPLSKSRVRGNAPTMMVSTAGPRRSPKASFWRWPALSLPLLLGFLCVGHSATLRAVDAAAATASAAASAASSTSSSAAADGTDSDTSTYESSWDSSPFNLQSVAENNLGLMARACSQTFCHAGITGLDLWVSLEEVRRHARPG